MLVHIDQPEVAERVHNAWLRTIEDGVHTYDIYTEGVSTQKVAPGSSPRPSSRVWGKTGEIEAGYLQRGAATKAAQAGKRSTAKKQLVGVDVFVDYTAGSANDLGAAMEGSPVRR